MTPNDLTPFTLSYAISAVGWTTAFGVVLYLGARLPTVVRRIRGWQATERQGRLNASTWESRR